MYSDAKEAIADIHGVLSGDKRKKYDEEVGGHEWVEPAF